MNVVKSGGQYQIYKNGLQTYDRLPCQAYEVCFSKFVGFYLVDHNDLKAEEKVYGTYQLKVDKILMAFADMNRNMGVICSGPKGVGKSLFARLLAEKGNAEGLPLIIVKEYIPGLESFLSTIEQEVIVLFDEFEKMFDKAEDQNSLLSLLDGIDNGKKLYVITCNEVNKLNSYMLNRPGRFHYHFKFETPSKEEVKEYMNDKLKEEFKIHIEKLANMAEAVKLTYDSLRAIAFELNHGYSLKETLADLNIRIDNMNGVDYELVLWFEDGKCITIDDVYYSVDKGWYNYDNWKLDKENHCEYNAKLRYENAVYDFKDELIQVPLENVEFNYYWDDVEKIEKRDPEKAEFLMNRKPVRAHIQKKVKVERSWYAF